MKNYQFMSDLIEDINITNGLHMDPDKSFSINYELYNQWYEVSPDSFKRTGVLTRELMNIYSTFIDQVLSPEHVENKSEKYKLFQEWKKDGIDSPWKQVCSEEDFEAASTLIKISEEGISSEWKGDHTIFVDIGSSKDNDSGKKPQTRYNLRTRG